MANPATLHLQRMAHSASPKETVSCHSKNAKQPLIPHTPRKSVRFHKTMRLRLTTHLNNYSVDEVASCWYTQDEFRLMKEIAYVYAERLEHCHQTQETDDRYCWRGLETLTRKGSHNRRKNRNAGLTAVFEEQSLQREEGIDEPHYISCLYKIASSRAEAQAHAAGLRDHIDAMR